MLRDTIGLNIKSNVAPGYRELIKLAIERMEYVLHDEKFGEFLELELLKSNDREGELSQWKNATAAQIFNQLLPITLHIETYYTWKGVIGYGLESDEIIRLNTKYLDKYSVFNDVHLMLIGSNLLHEHSHNKGFDHDFWNTSRRKSSLSYILNRAYERTYKYLYEIEEAPVKLPWWRRLFVL